ncbi:AAA domain-containing protein [Lichenibacterium ramalinae]|uniref:AAA domain-containing protein n=1 Tax=Lichenibacterium ramalinae TaxID=2316527 RepID=UPI001FE0FEEC|nr:AAA domain-containing protein [Lichenibacterium ramalinae]
MRRLVQALGIVHAQGLVHGRVSADSVMTEGSDEPDFKLAAFEWSLRLGDDVGPGGPARDDRYSFEGDWRALASLVAECLGHEVSPTGQTRPKAGQDTACHLSVAEATFVRTLARPRRSDDLDAASLTRSVDEIILGVGKGSEARAGTFLLCFSNNSGLDEAVFDATEGRIAVDEYRDQLEWVRADLDGGARLVVPRGFEPSSGRLRLVTTEMSYTLAPLLLGDGAPEWDVAICRTARRRGDDSNVSGEERVLGHPVEVAPSAKAAADARARLGPDALDWSGFAHTESAPASDDRTTLVRRSLALVQIVEALVRAFETYPVEILDIEVAGGRRFLVLRALPDNDRDGFARRIGLADTARTLRRLFEDDQRDLVGRWCLSRSNALGARRKDDIPVSLHKVDRHEGRRAYWFEVDDPVDAGGRWFLRLERDAGTEGQIRRRLKVIRDLDARVDLAGMLDDPWRARRSSRDAPPGGEGDERYGELDQSKQAALTGLSATLPSYSVVGPPGVGKTFLVTEVVRRRFEAERSSRLLVTAQGHDALDHLQRELLDALKGEGFPNLIVVRSTALDRPESAEDVRRTGSELLEALATSPLMADAPGPLQDRVAGLSGLAAGRGPAGADLAKEDGAALNALSSLVLDAANVVISTANSPDLARLVEAREQFDWVIVEEAAKATGPELVAPLMLSGRRLMIGDHHQLPPFDAERLRAILLDHDVLTQAVGLAGQHLGQLVRDGEVEEMQSLAQDPVKLRQVGNMALRLLEPFRTFVVEDERRAQGNPAHRRISSELTLRRMDPAIGEVVSKAFYDGKLETEPKRIEASEAESPPFEVLAPLPKSPIVVVEFEHLSRTGSPKPAERDRPRFHNPGEVDSVIDVLRRIRARPGSEKPPTLVVLSFYNAQVDKLSERIDAEVANGRLPGLAGFERKASGGWVSTVDGFQGSEADLVILSLVRNNPGTGASALGFLRDERRMNVALSRAKWKLVVVGSLGFLREAVRGVAPDGAAGDLTFLTRVDATIKDLMKRRRSDGTPKATIVGPETLQERGPTC